VARNKKSTLFFRLCGLMSCRKECPTQRNVAAGPGAAVKCRRLFTLNKAPKQRQLLQLQLSRGKKENTGRKAGKRGNASSSAKLFICLLFCLLGTCVCDGIKRLASQVGRSRTLKRKQVLFYSMYACVLVMLPFNELCIMFALPLALPESPSSCATKTKKSPLPCRCHD